VSRVHCELQVEGDGVVLHDSNSAAGTFVNGKRVTRQELRPGDIIQVGDTQLRYQALGLSEASTIGPGDQPAPASAAAPSQPLAILTGQTLGNYKIGPVLAKGQSGVVFKAEDTRDGQPVALKVLHPDFSKNDEEIQRFVRAMK